jgi:hypothetical protein
LTRPARHDAAATLVDLLDRVIDRGAVVTGDVTISVADVDLITLRLDLLLAAVERLQLPPRGERPARPRSKRDA